MKKLVLLVVAIATFGFASAQIEAKINPLGAIFGKPDISAEYIVSDSFGVELGVGFAFGKAMGVSVGDVYEPKQSGFGVKLAGKYYFSPDDGGDGWYGDIYLRQESLTIDDTAHEGYNGFKRSIFAAGVEFGKKWVFDSGFLVEAALGGGRAISEKNEWLNDNDSEDFGVKLGFDLTGKFAIGYRFN